MQTVFTKLSDARDEQTDVALTAEDVYILTMLAGDAIDQAEARLEQMTELTEGIEQIRKRQLST